jgi:hypothetical protein
MCSAFFRTDLDQRSRVSVITEVWSAGEFGRGMAMKVFNAAGTGRQIVCDAAENGVAVLYGW